MSLSIVLAAVLAAADGAPAPAPASPTSMPVPAKDDVSTLPVLVDEGVLLEALASLLDKANEPARVAVYVDDSDALRQRALERSLVRVLRERSREDVVSPSLVKATLDAAAEEQLKGGGGTAVKGLAADHALVAAVTESSGGATLQLRLLSVEDGRVVGTRDVAVAGDAVASTARALDVRAAAARFADVVAEGVEATGVDVKTHRIAVPPAQATGAAKDARLDRFLQSELSLALRERGFLVVERAKLGAAMDQLALQDLVGDERVADLGKLLGAQSLLLVQVADAGASFVVSARAVSVEGGSVVAAASATVEREGVVGLADVETRTPAEAAVRSAIAPGWGQAFNGETGKAVLFGLSTYGGLATTAALGIGAGASWAAYNGVSTEDGKTPAEASQQAEALRLQTNGLLTATAVAGAVTAGVWSLGVVDALLSAPSD